MISVIIPALNESRTIAEVVAFAQRTSLVSEVIVVDDGSIDGTPDLARHAGAKVVTSTLLGKGASMEDGLWAAQNEVVVYLDGDLSGLDDDLIPKLAAPLLRGQADFAKARFSRDSGRVTILTAKPLLATFFPELAHFAQPLGGIIAGTRSCLRNLTFENDYGVDVGLLIDVVACGGRVVEVDIGHIDHDGQSLAALGNMARQVMRVILNRASRYGRLHIDQVCDVQENERQAHNEMDDILSKVGKPDRLALFDMDGVLLRDRFILYLAQRTNKMTELSRFLDNPALEADERSRRIAEVFAGVPREVFEQTARSVPLNPGAVETVIALRRAGYCVGIVTDSYRAAAEMVRRRVFADFVVAHLMRFQRELATGEIILSPMMQHPNGCQLHGTCKMNALMHLCEKLGLEPEQFLAVGDGENDSCLLRRAGQSVAFHPKTLDVAQAAQCVIRGNLLEVLGIMDTRAHAAC